MSDKKIQDAEQALKRAVELPAEAIDQVNGGGGAIVSKCPKSKTGLHSYVNNKCKYCGAILAVSKTCPGSPTGGHTFVNGKCLHCGVTIGK